MKLETIPASSGPVRVRCYELRDKTARDRFTILFQDEPFSTLDARLRACLGLSGHGPGLPGRHLGKRVPFSKLPPELQRRALEA